MLGKLFAELYAMMTVAVRATAQVGDLGDSEVMCPVVRKSTPDVL